MFWFRCFLSSFSASFESVLSDVKRQMFSEVFLPIIICNFDFFDSAHLDSVVSVCQILCSDSASETQSVCIVFENVFIRFSILVLCCDLSCFHLSLVIRNKLAFIFDEKFLERLEVLFINSFSIISFQHFFIETSSSSNTIWEFWCCVNSSFFVFVFINDF